MSQILHCACTASGLRTYRLSRPGQPPRLVGLASREPLELLRLATDWERFRVFGSAATAPGRAWWVLAADLSDAGLLTDDDGAPLLPPECWRQITRHELAGLCAADAPPPYPGSV